MIAAKTSLNRAALKGGAATFVIAILATPVAAWAQTPATTAAAAAEEETIVVTGSLIKNPNLVSAAPVTVTTADTIQLRGSNVAEEVLRDIPGIVPNIGSAVNNGNGGASFVDLRGIGANRNIVLLDGQRIAPSGLAGQVDLNNIPLALVERVDALTGAAVTTYGADAISGVVNFVTKRDFSGVDLQLSNGLTEKGDGHSFRADLTVGGNFDGGRGNAVLSVGYQKTDPIYQGARSFSENTLDSNSGTFFGSGTAVPSRFTNSRPLTNGAPNTTAPFTQIGTRPGPNNPVTGAPTVIPILEPVPGGAQNGGFRQIAPNGSLVPNTSSFNFNPTNIFQTPFERFNMFARANYEIADGIEAYARGMFSKNSVKTIIAPSGSFSRPLVIPLSNPFLPATARNQFCAANIAPSVAGQLANGTSAAGPTSYIPRFTPAECNAAALATNPSDPNFRTVTTTVGRRTTETGTRNAEFATTLFDYQVGLRGDLSSTVGFDITGAYGESENRSTVTGYILNSRLAEAANATNKTTCLNSAAAGCVPIDLFGPEGSITPAMINYAVSPSTTTTSTSLAQLRGIVSGDFGAAVPGAADPIGFAVGVEYRKYKASLNPDLPAQTGDLGGGGGVTPIVNGGYDVKEVYGELIAPLVQDKPFFQNLTVEAGARYSSYNVDAPGNPSYDAFTWKAGGTWEIETGYKLRGNYSRAVRAPNIGELFSPVALGLTNLGTDPCAGLAPISNPTLGNVCVAQGATRGQLGFIAQPSAGQVNASGGGDPNTQPETATTWTIGTVLQPAFAPGLALTVDYYNIDVKNAITAQVPGDSIAACYGNLSAASLTNPACVGGTAVGIVRNPGTGSLDGSAAGLPRPQTNNGRIKTDGIDVTLSYVNDIGFAKLGVIGNFNYTFSNTFQAAPSSVVRECVGYYSSNCGFTGSLQPTWQSSLRTTLGFDNFDISGVWRHIDGFIQEPADADPADGDNAFFPAYQSIPAYDYFDLTGRVSVVENITVIMTVTNLFNKQPPIVGNTAGSTAFNSGNTFPSTFDALGRRYTMQVNVRF